MSTVSGTTSSSNSDIFAALNASSSSADSGSTQSASSAVSADTFLKLLVTQMENQDPLNPMDNSQMTSQLAQINTVSGISTLNTSVQALSSQFVQMQALQGASLVGRNVTVQGNGLDIENNNGIGGFTLAGAADTVSVDIQDSAGRTVDTLQLGAMKSGAHDFSWPAGTVPDGSNYTFKITAKSGAAAVSTTSMMRDKVDAISTDGNTLLLDLDRSGTVPYTAIQSFN